ncbi:MAG: hypothetical protein ACI39N_08500 [Lachnospiraceae bacterium]
MKVNVNLNILKKKQPLTSPSRMEWGFAVLMSALFFLTMFYVDNFGMFLTYFWTNEGLIDGRTFNALGYQGLPYGILHQWLCEIWVIPVNIIYHITGTGFDGTAALLWYKFFVTFFFILCMAETGKIAKTLEIDDEQIKWMQFFILTSLLVALPAFHVAQTDVTYLLLMLMGFHAYLKDDYKKFIIYFALAIPLKIIAIFAFIPLILLKEKRIFYVIRDLILGCIIVPVEQILYRLVDFLNRTFISASQTVIQSQTVVQSQTVAQEAEKTTEEVKLGFMQHFYYKSLYFEFPAVRKGLVASLLVFVFVLLCIWCYMQKRGTIREWKKTALYAVTTSLSIFFVMASPSPYWIIILYPFLFLLLFSNKDCFRINMLLQHAFTLTMLFVFVIDTYWVFGGSMTFDWLFLSKWGLLPGNHKFQEGPSIAGYLEKYGLDVFMPVMTAICLGSIIGILWINHPKSTYTEELDENYRIKLQHGFAIFGIALMVIWYAANIVLLGRY